MKTILIQIDQLEKQIREKKEEAENLRNKIKSEDQGVRSLYSTMVEFWSHEISINDLVHHLSDNYLPPTERTEIIAKLAAENEKKHLLPRRK